MYQHSVVLLAPDNDLPTVYSIVQNINTKKLDLAVNVAHDDPAFLFNRTVNLHFLSNETIHEDDWYYNHDTKEINCALLNITDRARCSKVIASTEDSYNLPRPSEKFIKYYIEKYNEDNPITKVEIAYTNDYVEPPAHIHSNRGYFKSEILVNEFAVIQIKITETNFY